jgi:hypothetical protein
MRRGVTVATWSFEIIQVAYLAQIPTLSSLGTGMLVVLLAAAAQAARQAHPTASAKISI